jgi:ketosteroid isomerase-like protein
VTASIEAELRAWLEEFAGHVRDVDYESARAQFAPDVIGFGTYSAVLVGLDDLVRNQWMNIWPVTNGFRFRLKELRYSSAGDIAWVACPWDSNGKAPDGRAYERPGRATIGFRRGPDGRWLATHTHLSLYPRPS